MSILILYYYIYYLLLHYSYIILGYTPNFHLYYL